METVLRDPLLYISLYLKRNRDEYYRLLDSVRRDGDWEEWVGFFADGVTESSGGAVAEITGRRRNRVFRYAGYVRIPSEGTEPLGS